jgi:hypothetical protein
MDDILRGALLRQFGAAIDMFENALRACPDDLWRARLWGGPQAESSEFWYLGYHTLFWLDLYLHGSIEGFVPPAPFTLDELDPAGLLPEKPHSRGVLLAYLDASRRKARAAIEALTDADAGRICKVRWGEVSYLELLLDNMRHVQEHGAQLSLFLGQQRGSAAKWVSRSANG